MTNVVLTGLARELARRADEGRPVRIGVIGSGEMGTDLVTQCMLMKGVTLSAIATRRPATAKHAIEIAYGETSRFAETGTFRLICGLGGASPSIGLNPGVRLAPGTPVQAVGLVTKQPFGGGGFPPPPKRPKTLPMTELTNVAHQKLQPPSATNPLGSM